MFRRMLALSAILALTSIGVAWAAPQPPAAPTITHRWVQQFAMVTPAFGQTLRVHAFRMGVVEPPPDPDAPVANPPPVPEFAPPCRVLLAFIDSEGRLIGTPVGKALEPGHSTFLDLSFAPPATNAVPPGPCRAAVWVFLDVPRGETPPDPCRTSLELLDTVTGRASLHMLPAAQHALPAVQK